ncbi:MAG: hypothetical protein R3B06_14430 [Kofleriaceae bacterium]
MWQCRRPRTDGCPEEVPAGACPQPGQQCSYGDCCISTSTCTDGQWVNGEASCPP